MEINKNQIKFMGKAIFLEKLSQAFCRDIESFRELDADERAEFLIACQLSAESNGLVTEQGIASYALAAWWLGIGFEEKSRYLRSLFNSRFAEVRKVYAMNDWVHVMIGTHDVSTADEQLKKSFYRTFAWG